MLTIQVQTGNQVKSIEIEILSMSRLDLRCALKCKKLLN